VLRSMQGSIVHYWCIHYSTSITPCSLVQPLLKDARAVRDRSGHAAQA